MRIQIITQLLPALYIIVCERIARVENCPAQELLFSESIARNMARLFFDEQIAKTKLK